MAQAVLRRAAMDYLARREHSLFELRRKLQLRFPDSPADSIDTVTAALRDENLQSDERFVESYIRYRKERGFAYRHIRNDLLQRGVSERLINRHLHTDDPDWPQLLNSLITRRLDPGAMMAFGSREHRRLARFLEYRGFPVDKIRAALQPRLR